VQQLSVRGVRWVDDEPQPGWVEVEFTDADGVRQVLQGKWVDFASDWPSKSAVPEDLSVQCEPVGPMRSDGTVKVALDLPWVDDGRTFRVDAHLLR
jgi:hypothetical protein